MWLRFVSTGTSGPNRVSTRGHGAELRGRSPGKGEEALKILTE